MLNVDECLQDATGKILRAHKTPARTLRLMSEEASAEEFDIFIQAIDRLMKERGLNDHKLTDVAGLSHGYVNRLRHGRRVPKLVTQRKLAKALGVTVPELTGDAIATPTDQPKPIEIEKVIGLTDFAEILHLLAIEIFEEYEADTALGDFRDYVDGKPKAPELKAAVILRKAVGMAVNGVAAPGPLYYARGATETVDVSFEATGQGQQSDGRLKG